MLHLTVKLADGGNDVQASRQTQKLSLEARISGRFSSFVRQYLLSTVQSSQPLVNASHQESLRSLWSNIVDLPQIAAESALQFVFGTDEQSRVIADMIPNFGP